MSDYIIRATPQELRQRAGEIESNAETVRREVDRISQEIDKLRPTFVGHAATKFLKDYTTARTDMENWDDVVRQFADLLRQTAANLETIDQKHGG